jgi:hypothetical protein
VKPVRLAGQHQRCQDDASTDAKEVAVSRESDFFAAVEAGDLPSVRAMLAVTPDLVHARDNDGATALHHAAFHAHRLLVELLCATGADLNARDFVYGATPAGWALHYLRELGGFLAIEIDDVLHAVQIRDVAWAQRLVERHPRIATTLDAAGRPLSAHAGESGSAEIADLFKVATKGR